MQMVMKYSFAKMLTRTDILEFKVLAQSYLQYYYVTFFLLYSLDDKITELQTALKRSEETVEEAQDQLSTLTKELEALKCMISALGLDYKHFSKAKRESNSTSKTIITDSGFNTRYRRRKETKKALTFLHGGKTGSFYGAWDYIAANAPKELITELIVMYKRGNHLKKIFSNAMNMPQAVATKYQNHLSRRKYTLVCRTQSSFFDPESETWLPRNISCAGIDLRLPKTSMQFSGREICEQLEHWTCHTASWCCWCFTIITGLQYSSKILKHLCLFPLPQC